jgi:hypothetical protein
MTRLPFFASLALLVATLALAAPSRRDGEQGLNICAKAYEAKVPIYIIEQADLPRNPVSWLTASLSTTNWTGKSRVKRAIPFRATRASTTTFSKLTATMASLSPHPGASTRCPLKERGTSRCMTRTSRNHRRHSRKCLVSNSNGLHNRADHSFFSLKSFSYACSGGIPRPECAISMWGFRGSELVAHEVITFPALEPGHTSDEFVMNSTTFDWRWSRLSSVGFKNARADNGEEISSGLMIDDFRYTIEGGCTGGCN